MLRIHQRHDSQTDGRTDESIAILGTIAILISTKFKTPIWKARTAVTTAADNIYRPMESAERQLPIYQTRTNCETTSDRNGRPISVFGLHTGWLKKASCILWWIFQQSRTIFKFFHCYTQQEIYNKEVITDVTTSKSVTTLPSLQNINFQKLFKETPAGDSIA